MINIYWTVLLGAIFYTGVDINVIHRNYNLRPENRAILFLHSLVIFYLILGTAFPDRYNTMLHLAFSLGILALWEYHGHCVLSMYMEKTVDYSEDDYKVIIMDYPTRRAGFIKSMIPVIVVDVIKLLLLKK